ncbi:hypothetical protein AURDEDRAFT_112293 [Auricularia subglabra TFB-10046 SS5]|nr:hypothetical protein AURDEDRAFT_112293 [Auricularia subglabra TFB-10046 SS5]
MLVITVLAPVVGAFIAARFAPRTSKGSPHGCPDDPGRSSRCFRYYKLVALWFVSIAVFGTLVYLQSGHTTRGTFVLAVAHNQIEVLLNCLLLNLSYRRSLCASIIYGFIMYPIVLFAPSMAIVFIGAAVVGGANDFLIVCLLSYGRQWVLAAGALAHVFSAVSVFTCTIDNFGVLPYNFSIFLGIWTHIGLTLAGILYARELHRMFETRSDAVLPSGAHEKERHNSPNHHRDHVANTAENGRGGGLVHSRLKVHTKPRSNGTHSPPPNNKGVDLERQREYCYARNPMWHVPVPSSALIAMVVLSLVGSTLITVALAYWVPLWGEKYASPSRLSWVWHILGDSISPGQY